jgi:membrane-associated protein
MHMLVEFFHKLRNLEELIRWGGYTGLAAIIFAETGLLVGFFLPGDSLLVTAGVLASTTRLLNIWYLNALLIVMAIVGDAVGYQIGRRAGPSLFKREESLLFKPSHLLRTKEFYDKHGGKTIIIARFMPFARTFAPVVAGIAGMPYRRFAIFNFVGGVSWVLSMTVLGYFLGQLVSPKRIEHIVYLIILVSVMPVVIEVLKNRRRPAPPPAVQPGAAAQAQPVSAPPPSSKA